jgi:hypothetical protein
VRETSKRAFDGGAATVGVNQQKLFLPMGHRREDRKTRDPGHRRIDEGFVSKLGAIHPEPAISSLKRRRAPVMNRLKLQWLQVE